MTGAEFGDRSEWLDWDFALVYAFQTIEDYSDDYGLLAWELEDERVEVNANKKIHKFKAAIDRTTSGKNYKASPGEYFIPEIFVRGKDATPQTFQEWIEKEAKKHGPVE